MSDGHRINTPPPKVEMPPSRGNQDSPRMRGNSHHDTPPPGHLKHNSAQHFNHEWQNSRANELKNNLLTVLLGSQQQQTNHSNNAQQSNHSNSANHSQHSQSANHGQHSHAENRGNRHSFASTATNYASQSLQNLINLAREHTDFRNFQNRTENFWQNVGRMSEVRILQTQAGDIQLVSRYGELLDRFTSQGGRLENFLLSLPAAEREVFAARYQLEKTFGADKLFIGNGITPDKNGDFGVRQFLASNGKAVDLPLNAAVALRESGLLGANNSFLVNGRILFNAESAALLGASLAFYQNLGATVNIKDAVVYNLLQNFLISAKENAAQVLPVNLFTAEASARKIDQSTIVGALINGSLQTVDKNARFFDKINLERWKQGEKSNRLGFSAGATGAMLGAAIGCLVPLSGEIAGRATGLATSIVIGTAERGLRSINLNLLISDVVTNAVQTLLDTLQNNFLPDAVKAQLPAASPVEDLCANFSNRRINAYLAA